MFYILVVKVTDLFTFVKTVLSKIVVLLQLVNVVVSKISIFYFIF